MDIICIRSACFHGEVTRRGSRTSLRHSWSLLKGTGFMSTSSTRALYFKPYGCCQSQAAFVGELLQDVIRTVQCSSAKLWEDSEEYSDDQSSGINCIIPWTLLLAPDLLNPFNLPVHGWQSVVQSDSLELLLPFQFQLGRLLAGNPWYSFLF